MMERSYDDEKCLVLENLSDNLKFLAHFMPTTLAALVVAMTSAPDTGSDADVEMQIREKMVETAWSLLESNVGPYTALRMMQESQCGVATGIQ